MGRRHSLPGLLLGALCLLVTGTLTAYGLYKVNERMTVRYQAVGQVFDQAGNPMEGVEVVLLLTPPPPAGPHMDAVFAQDGADHARHGREGQLKRAVGPTIGLSAPSGTYIVRATGRTGAARAIRLGLDSGGKPPFETAWLILRKEGYRDLTRTLSILGWQQAGPDWGTHANRLPPMTMTRRR